jgi:hypothetical protein
MDTDFPRRSFRIPEPGGDGALLSPSKRRALAAQPMKERTQPNIRSARWYAGGDIAARCPYQGLGEGAISSVFIYG